MKRRCGENSHETSSPLTTRLLHDIDIPLDLTVEILKKLPTKSLMRFRCVSKLWSSIITMRRDFIDWIVTRSLTQTPCDAHRIFNMNLRCYTQCYLSFSSTNARNTHKESVSIPRTAGQYVRGLFLCLPCKSLEAAISNPTTRQYFNLPKMKHSGKGNCFFGYDPLENQYKVLFIPKEPAEQPCQVFTLGDPMAKQWRNIQGIESQFPIRYAYREICINGVIYFITRSTDTSFEYNKLISFDIRSEKFHHIDTPKTLIKLGWFPINYQGKLGLMYCKDCVEIWVMENAEKKTQRWSKIFFYEMAGFEKWCVPGVTRGGEIVFSNSGCLYDNDVLRVFYYNPNCNSMRYVDLEDIYPKESRPKTSLFIWTIPDYVENTMCLY
ncbi:unnamed protein product [Microthlaspi erraticum]|uniref:F-box domain-containing protein n=1 Tax=Microthlaspi erraticum TaxID=1685480 RepID=A0A6D2KT84_9BRAS|nr:unnamed protein product [Microthlaspi erraticum]